MPCMDTNKQRYSETNKKLNKKSWNVDVIAFCNRFDATQRMHAAAIRTPIDKARGIAGRRLRVMHCKTAVAGLARESL